MKFNKEILQVLCPFGEWKHSRGMQIVDEESVMQMKRASRWMVFAPIPIYVGHPDDSPSRKKPKPIGRIKRICRTKDGIAVVAAYSEESYKYVVEGKYAAMSPRWQMSDIGGGRFRPIRLISVGLTNNPNIPESGRIVSAQNPLNIGNLESGKNISRNIGGCSERIRAIARNAKNIRKQIDSLKISERLASRTEAKKSVAERKIQAARLADMARERSERLGEPYTKSFAFVKKQIL